MIFLELLDTFGAMPKVSRRRHKKIQHRIDNIFKQSQSLLLIKSLVFAYLAFFYIINMCFTTCKNKNIMIDKINNIVIDTDYSKTIPNG